MVKTSDILILIATGVTKRLVASHKGWVDEAQKLGIRTEHFAEENRTIPYNVHGVGKCPSWMHCRRNSHENMWKMFEYAAQQKEVKFIYKCDDDTLVFVKRFIYFINEYQADIAHGGVYGECHTFRHNRYCSGGAGYVMGKQTLQKILKMRNYDNPTFLEDQVVTKRVGVMHNVDGFSSNPYCLLKNDKSNLFHVPWISVHYATEWMTWWARRKSDPPFWNASVVHSVRTTCANNTRESGIANIRRRDRSRPSAKN